jgi:hypothetical protein
MLDKRSLNAHSGSMTTKATPSWRKHVRLSMRSLLRVTDAGLKDLKPLSDLRWVDVRMTAVTEPGLKELQRALPMLGYSR